MQIFVNILVKCNTCHKVLYYNLPYLFLILMMPEDEGFLQWLMVS